MKWFDRTAEVSGGLGREAAIMYNRFAVDRIDRKAKAQGCSIRPFHGQEVPRFVNISDHCNK
jgi:hypothetical protein